MAPNYARFASPGAPSSRFPQLRLANSTVGPESSENVVNDIAFKQSIGWTLLDVGNDQTDYAPEPSGLLVGQLIPRGFHAERPSASWTDGSTPQQFWAIVPDRKTRADIGA